jgi:hypothetical protein
MQAGTGVSKLSTSTSEWRNVRRNCIGIDRVAQIYAIVLKTQSFHNSRLKGNPFEES